MTSEASVMVTKVNEGVFALIGVVVGAVAPGAPTWLLARRVEKRDRRVAARLVREEVVVAGSMLESGMQHGWFKEFDLGLEKWDAHSDVLAGELSTHSWDKVAQAMGTLHQANTMLSSITDEHGGYISPNDIPEDGKDVITAAIAELQSAKARLDDLA